MAAHWAMWKRRQSSTNWLARYQALRKKPLKKSLCNAAVKALVDLMTDTAAEAAVDKRRQNKRCAQRGINCTEAGKLPDAEADKPDHLLGDLWAEAVINTVADNTGRQCGHPLSKAYQHPRRQTRQKSTQLQPY